MHEEKVMKLDPLSVRRTLRAVQRGLPVPESLVLTDAILDGLDEESMQKALEELIAMAQSCTSMMQQREKKQAQQQHQAGIDLSRDTLLPQ
jgi:hypothetical protein